MVFGLQADIVSAVLDNWYIQNSWYTGSKNIYFVVRFYEF